MDWVYQKRWNEFRRATVEWSRAADATKAFAVLESPLPESETELHLPDYYERMDQAYERAEAARKSYFAKLRALQQCRHKEMGIVF